MQCQLFFSVSLQTLVRDGHLRLFVTIQTCFCDNTFSMNFDKIVKNLNGKNQQIPPPKLTSLKYIKTRYSDLQKNSEKSEEKETVIFSNKSIKKTLLISAI